MKFWKLLLIISAVAVVGAAGYVGYFGFKLPAQLPFQPPSPQSANAQVTPPPTVPVSTGDVRQLVSAPGTLVGTQKMELSMGAQGTIAEIPVRAGDAVKKGQTLAKLGDQGKYEGAVSAARVDLLTARQDLDDLKANAPKESADAYQALIDAQDALKKAQTKVEALKYPRASESRLDGVYNDYQAALQNVAIAQDRFDNAAGLAPDDPRRVDSLQQLTAMQKEKDRLLGVYNWLSAKPTDQEKADAQAKLDTAKAVYDSAQRKWERVKSGPDAMALELAQAKVADKERLLAQAEADLAHLTLTAPFAGVVTEVKVGVGDQVTAVAPVLTLTNPSALEAQVTVVEEDYALIQPGQAVQLYFDAQPDATVTGHVSRIVPSRTSDTQPQYPVYIAMDQLPERLAAGMTVDASIIITEKKGVLVLPKALVRARTDGSATVQVWANGRKESREIKIGLIGDSNVEIVSGLQEGELVAQ